MHGFLKDFAGPIATIIASAVAAYFVRQQWLTAEKQANTAIDQLRYNLLEKRYAIYDKLKQLILLLIREDKTPFDIVPYYAVVDEAIFFFSPETCAWLQSVKEDCRRYEEVSSPHHFLYNTQEATALGVKLLQHFEAMPERFQKELGFRQLTQKET
jgi:hypothetical protein